MIAAVEAAEMPRRKERIGSAPRPNATTSLGVPQAEIADAADEDIADDDIEKPQSTLTVDEESPCPGGLANGL